MQLVQFDDVETTRALWLPGMDEVKIAPVGDIQLDPKRRGQPRRCDVDRFRRHIDWAMKNDCLLIGMGDYIDPASPSGRDKLAGAKFYDTIKDMMEETALELQEEIEGILKGTEGKWLGLLGGHHYWPFEDGTTTDTRLAKFLQTEYLGTCTAIRLNFQRPEASHKPTPGFTIWAHHGRGGGKLLSAPLNQLEHVLKWFDADVYLIGHHHQKVVGKRSRMALLQAPRGGRPRLVHKNVIIACTGAFLKGYQQDSARGGQPAGSYVEEAMYSPSALGGIVIWARPRQSSNGYATVDLDFSG